MQIVTDESKNIRISAMVHLILGQILADDPDIGLSAMLNIFISESLERGICCEQFLKMMKESYDYYEKNLKEEKSSI